MLGSPTRASRNVGTFQLAGNRARNLSHRDCDEVGRTWLDRRRIYRHCELNNQLRQRSFGRTDERLRWRDQVDGRAGVGELDRIVDTSFGSPGKRTIRDDGAGIIRVEDKLGYFVLAGTDLSGIEELRIVVLIVEVDLQRRRAASSLSDSRGYAYFLPFGVVGSGVYFRIDPDCLNIQQNILKGRRGRRDAKKADLDPRGLSAGQGRAKTCNYYRKCNREGQSQVANSPRHT
jgi:hypothetical protein